MRTKEVPPQHSHFRNSGGAASSPHGSCPKGLQAFGLFQELLGHEDITTTEIYLHVAVGTNGLNTKSPLDGREISQESLKIGGTAKPNNVVEFSAV